MKLRQKLAAVLAATMLATSVPVVTMAQSQNALTTGVVVAAKDAQVTAATLVIKPEGATTAFANNQTFFVNIQNAEWLTTSADVTFGGAAPDAETVVSINDKKQLQVTIKNANLAANASINIPLKVKLTGGEATVSVDSNGSEINDMSPVVFARTNEAKASVSVADAKSINYRGAIADITIQEAVKGTLKTDWITLTLDNTNYEFVAVPQAANVKLSGGFGTSNGVTLDGSEYVGTDNGQVRIKLSALSTVAPGRIVLEGLEIRAKDRNVAVGEDISITVSGEQLNDSTVKVAKSVELGNSIEMKDDKVVEITAGKKGKVTFSIKENVNDSIIDGRTTIVTLDKGYLTNTNALGQTLSLTAKLNNSTVAISAVPITNSDDYITGFEFTMPTLDGTKADKLTFENLEVFVPLTAEGDITISAEGRAIGDKIQATAVKVNAPVEVTTQAMTLKVGLKDQVGGKITIKETKAGNLASDKLVIDLPDELGMTFATKAPTVKVVEGDMQIGTVKVVGKTVEVTVSRTSKTASTIEIAGFTVSADRTLAEGSYDASVSGAALLKDGTTMVDVDGDGKDKNTLAIKGFVVVGTANTEDLASNGLRKGISTFAIGNKNFTVNGVTEEMDAAPYISDGRTMVPVRFVANALGVSAKDIYFANGVVTIIAGNKTVSLTVGDKVARLNGAPARVMTTAPVIKDGRTFVPVSEIGALLGVNANWNAETKVATFENK
ncbi:stalk domain-containing protein [Cellulosilyticum sp. I15G10I2]|uniref:stalk domain-containing protein n=1 Tax=Cellulosilyticum sp. I15G10I2 TaxID=1892843 RepID=UPI00085C6A43|nr:copper amine oxidase N-terminal domain-containing protein [Cellulosilyticum sp. I15G10I2]